MLSITVEKRFQVPVWDEVAQQKAIDFWSRRGVVFSETSGAVLCGKRGNLLGNLTSFNMSKLMAKLTINVSKQNDLHCVLNVNTVFQQITEYNRAWWDLEMNSFESFLLQNDEQEEKWEKFGINYKKAAWTWSFTNGIGGNRMPPEDKP